MSFLAARGLRKPYRGPMKRPRAYRYLTVQP